MSGSNVGCWPAALTAEMLDKAGVPNVLWGWWSFSLTNVYHPFPEVEFVVVDDKLDAAVAALKTSNRMRFCADPNCPETRADKYPNERQPRYVNQATSQHMISPAMAAQIMATNRFHILADQHFHLDARGGRFSILRLYRKSRMLWWLPEIPLGPVGNDDLILSTDPSIPASRENGGMGTGPWTDLYPVKTLRAARLYESVILLFCIHWAAADESYDVLDNMVSTGVMDTKKEDKSKNPVYVEIRDNLKPEFKAVWDSFHPPVPRTTPRTENINFPLLRLRKKLLAGELSQSLNMPPLPLINPNALVRLPDIE
ncbi:uncharacterized protein DSM5745_08193 [Aspergillus mulundensis]|uniref:Uncharacterized protein n=1 Tax=Aspergillus mulundensis TaxID=1810919 RepID=A0A3D8R9F3_9EURO|nr:hypothetical protein DSM5745_08193 [Aspergillus mulundensis]RDW70682.1 hypothetical protein DSM5745_08193 [Aspergillus mulundensis]